MVVGHRSELLPTHQPHRLTVAEALGCTPGHKASGRNGTRLKVVPESRQIGVSYLLNFDRADSGPAGRASIAGSQLRRKDSDS